MKVGLVSVAAMLSLATTGCATTGQGGASNATNRALVGVLAGALLGGAVGHGTGAIIGAAAGGAIGAAADPKGFRRDTRGYCYGVDAQGRPIIIDRGDGTQCTAGMPAPPPAG